MDCLEAAIDQVSPIKLLERSLRFEKGILSFLPSGEKYDLSKCDKVLVVGAGKASGYLAQSLEKIIGSQNITAGYVNVLQGTKRLFRTKKIKINEASHPTPNEAGVRGAKQIAELLKAASDRSLVICLISGGGSSLLPLPPPDIPLKDEIETTDFLLKAGASIDDINCVRKHISLVKGGQLVRLANQSPRFLSLIISDVVGDHLESIASGPTYPDSTTYQDALEVLRRYDLTKIVPKTVLIHLNKGAAGKIPETPKSGSKLFSKVSNHIIASNKDACRAITEKLSRGRTCNYLGSSWRGEASDLARNLVGLFCQDSISSENNESVQSFVWGGEATVTVRGTGVGGRNQEEALSALASLGDCSSRSLTVAFFATDGIDGNTNCAGAIVDADSYRRAKKMHLSLKTFLSNNDSNSYFRKLRSSLIISGPTGTNVNDIGIAIVHVGHSSKKIMFGEGRSSHPSSPDGWPK